MEVARPGTVQLIGQLERVLRWTAGRLPLAVVLVKNAPIHIGGAHGVDSLNPICAVRIYRCIGAVARIALLVKNLLHRENGRSAVIVRAPG